MRKDLNKLLCEHERHRSSSSFHSVRHNKHFNVIEEDSVAPFESMTKRHNIGWNRKDFGENLNPLFGAVRKAVGTKWNDFYSELCQKFDMRGVINAHILQHLYDYICKDAYIGKDGQIYVPKYYLGDEPLSESRFEFYVDPRDGLIKKNKHYKTYTQRYRETKAKKATEIARTERWIDERTVLKLIDDTWFSFDYLPTPIPSYVFTRGSEEKMYTPNDDGVEVRWEDLSERDKNRLGVKIKINGTVYDELKKETVFCSNFSQVTKYYTNKKTASKKQLKAAGIR